MFDLLSGCVHCVLYHLKINQHINTTSMWWWVSTQTCSPRVTQTQNDKLPETLYWETSWTRQQHQRSVPFCCITLHVWFGLSVKCLVIRSPRDPSTSRSQLRHTNVNLWWGKKVLLSRSVQTKPIVSCINGDTDLPQWGGISVKILLQCFSCTMKPENYPCGDRI